MNGIKRKIIICVVIIISLLFFIGFPFYRAYSGYSEMKISDMNGDSKELAIITDEMILGESEYSAIGVHSSRKGAPASGIKGEYEELDFESGEFSCKRMSGVYVVNAFLSEGEQRVTYKVSSQVTSGNMRIVIAEDGGKFLHDIPIDEKHELTFETAKNKIYYLKVAAEDSEFEITVERSVDE